MSIRPNGQRRARHLPKRRIALPIWQIRRRSAPRITSYNVCYTKLLRTDLKSLLKDPSLLETRAFVAGEWVEADDGARFDVTNPARGDVICSVPDLGRAETARAIAAAQEAMKDWAARTGKERAQVLRKWFDP